MWPNPQFPAIRSHLLKKSLLENFIFCAVTGQKTFPIFVNLHHADHWNLQQIRKMRKKMSLQKIVY